MAQQRKAGEKSIGGLAMEERLREEKKNIIWKKLVKRNQWRSKWPPLKKMVVCPTMIGPLTGC